MLKPFIVKVPVLGYFPPRSDQQYINLLNTSESIILLVIEKVNLLRDFLML